jgi:hypothetical protein
VIRERAFEKELWEKWEKGTDLFSGKRGQIYFQEKEGTAEPGCQAYTSDINSTYKLKILSFQMN